MAKYRVIKPAYLPVNGHPWPRICQIGEIVDFDGVPGGGLEPLDNDARAAKARAGSRPRLPNGLQVGGGD